MKSLTFITHFIFFWILHPIWGESEAIETYLKTDNVQVQCSLYNVTFSINSPFSYPSELFVSLSSSQTNIRVYGEEFRIQGNTPSRQTAVLVLVSVEGRWLWPWMCQVHDWRIQVPLFLFSHGLASLQLRSEKARYGFFTNHIEFPTSN